MSLKIDQLEILLGVDNGTSASEGEDFRKVLAIHGHGSHHDYVIRTIYINFAYPSKRG